MTNWAVRKLGAGDVALARQLLAFFDVVLNEEEEGVMEPRVASDDFLARLLAKEDFHAFVVIGEGRIVGGLTAYELEKIDESRELFIYDVAVDASFRRQGVGGDLIERAEELCLSRGLNAMYLAAMADDARAVRFYESTALNERMSLGSCGNLKRVEDGPSFGLWPPAQAKGRGRTATDSVALPDKRHPTPQVGERSGCHR